MASDLAAAQAGGVAHRLMLRVIGEPAMGTGSRGDHRGGRAQHRGQRRPPELDHSALDREHRRRADTQPFTAPAIEPTQHLQLPAPRPPFGVDPDQAQCLGRL